MFKHGVDAVVRDSDIMMVREAAVLVLGDV